MKLKGAIFDLDGTLLDSMPFWENVGITYLRQRGHNPSKEINNILKTMNLKQSARYFQKEFSISDSEEEIKKELIKLIENQYRWQIPLKTSVRPFLENLYAHKVKMCIATATDLELAKAALERLNVTKYFEFILTCSEAGMGKDTPEFFLKALDLLNTPQQKTLVFEDALHAIKSAKEAGFPVVAIYDKSSHGEQEEIKALADIYLNSFADWETIVGF